MGPKRLRSVGLTKSLQLEMFGLWLEGWLFFVVVVGLRYCVIYIKQFKLEIVYMLFGPSAVVYEWPWAINCSFN